MDVMRHGEKGMHTEEGKPLIFVLTNSILS